MLATAALVWRFIPAIVKQIAVVLLLLAGIYVYAYAKGDIEGRAVIQHRWDAAVTAAIDKGNQAREDAEASVPPVLVEPVAGATGLPGAVPRPAPAPCRVRDKFDRDCN